MDNVLFGDHNDGLGYYRMSAAREKALNHHASYSVEYLSKILGKYITRYGIDEADARRLQKAINVALDYNTVYVQELTLSGEILTRPYHIRIYKERGI